MTIPVQFTLEAAQRISNAVRRVEIGDRSQSPLTFDSFIPQITKQIAYGHRMATDFGAWPFGTTRSVRLHGAFEKTPVFGAPPPGGGPVPILGTHEDPVIVQAINLVGDYASIDAPDLTSYVVPPVGGYRREGQPPNPTLVLAKLKRAQGDTTGPKWAVIGPAPAQCVYGKIFGRIRKNGGAFVYVRSRYFQGSQTIDGVGAFNPFGAIGTPLTAAQTAELGSRGPAWAYNSLPGTYVCAVRTVGDVSGWAIVAAECP